MLTKHPSLARSGGGVSINAVASPQTFPARAGIVNPQTGVLEGIGGIVATIWVFLLVGRLHEIVFYITDVSLYPFRLLYPLGAFLWLVSGGAYRTFANRVGLGFVLLTGWFMAGAPFSSWRGGTARWLAFWWASNTITFLVCAGLLFSLVHWRRCVHALGWSSPLIAALAFVFGSSGKFVGNWRAQCRG